jgi:methionyl-tRNA synthetase
MLDLVATPSNKRTFAALDAAQALKPGTPLPAPQGVFPRIVDEKAAE